MVLVEADDENSDLAENAERRVVAHVRDSFGQDAGAQGVDQVLDVCAGDPKYASESLSFGAADLVVDVQAVGHELLADAERMLGAREWLPDARPRQSSDCARVR